MGSIPSLGARRERLAQIDGAMPRLTAIPPGCAFNPRCPKRVRPLPVERPDADAGARQRAAACWLYDRCVDAAGGAWLAAAEVARSRPAA